MTDSADEKERWQLYSDHAKQTWGDIQSSTDSFDKGVLAVSSGALGASLTFIKDIVPLKNAVWLPSLYLSWLALGLAVIVTVLSFRLSTAALNRHLDFLWKFYIENDKEYFNKQSFYSKALRWSTWLATGLFLLGLSSMLLFYWLNIRRIAA